VYINDRNVLIWIW